MNWKKRILCILVTFFVVHVLTYDTLKKHLWWSNSFLTTWNPSKFSRHSFIHSKTALWQHTVQQELPMILKSITTKWSKLVIIHSLLDQTNLFMQHFSDIVIHDFHSLRTHHCQKPPHVLESPRPPRSYMKGSAWVKPSYIREIQHRHLMVIKNH